MKRLIAAICVSVNVAYAAPEVTRPNVTPIDLSKLELAYKFNGQPVECTIKTLKLLGGDALDAQLTCKINDMDREFAYTGARHEVATYKGQTNIYKIDYNNTSKQNDMIRSTVDTPEKPVHPSILGIVDPTIVSIGQFPSNKAQFALVPQNLYFSSFPNKIELFMKRAEVIAPMDVTLSTEPGHSFVVLDRTPNQERLHITSYFYGYHGSDEGTLEISTSNFTIEQARDFLWSKLLELRKN